MLPAGLPESRITRNLGKTQLIQVVKFRAPSEAQRKTAALRQFARLEKQRGSQLTRFRRMMAFAKDLNEQNPEALELLISALARIVQSEAIVEPIIHSRDVTNAIAHKRYLFFDPSFPISPDNRSLREIIVATKSTETLELGRDVVLPWPWRASRLRGAMAELASGGTWGSWKADPNHQVEFWEPIRIGWVHGGNHSLAVGILLSRGKLKPQETYNIAPVYGCVSCDGRVFRRVHDHAIISEVASAEMAAIFEIGRMLVNNCKR